MAVRPASTASEVEEELQGSTLPASFCPDSDDSKATSSAYRYVLQSFEFFQPSNCRSFKFFSTCMASNNQGPVGPSGSPRLPNSIYLQSSSGTSSCDGLHLTGESVINRSGGARTTCKTSSSLCSNQQAKRTRVHQFPLCSPQKGWGSQASNQSKTPKQLHSIRTFQNGIKPHVKGSSKEGGLLSKSGLKDAYLTVPIWEKHQKYLRFLWRDSLLEFACLPFGLASAPRVFTKLLKPVLSFLRQRGIRLIAYLDDFLIMAESKQLALQHAATTLNILEGLGFVINYQKSLLIPSQQIEFLGYIVNSVSMSLSLPKDKLKKVQNHCQKLLHNPLTTVRELSKVLGLLSSSIQAVFPAPLHYRYLQQAKNSVLKKQNSYEALIFLNSDALEEVRWWRNNLVAWNGRALLHQSTDLTIETDASLQGWGAHCQGISTGGRWPRQESPYHINCLELLAGSLAVQCFTKNLAKAQVLLLMDNVTAVTYINKMGGTHSPILSLLAKNLWDWCLSHNVLIKPQYIPGIQNVLADRESRIFLDSSDWKLHPAIFNLIYRRWGPLNIDLFASRLTFQLDQYVSWRPDPSAVHTDAFTLDWATFRGYAFPPFSVIGWCLQLVQSQRVEHLVIVTPVWPTQIWYPLLLTLYIDFPILLPVQKDLLTREGRNHPLPQLQLAGWLLSTVATKREDFLAKLETSSSQLGGKTPQVHIPQPGTSGVAGVLNEGQLIPFHHL